MGMQYHLVYNDAVIPPENYLNAGTPEKRLHATLAHIEETLRDEKPSVGPEGITISGLGFWGSASGGFWNCLTELLAMCGPSAHIEGVNMEGEPLPYRVYVLPGGGLVEISPTITWEQPEHLLAQQ